MVEEQQTERGSNRNANVPPIAVLALLFILGLSSCQRDYTETLIDLSDYEIQQGLQLECLAAEPLIEAPVSLSFDDQGRMWVLEMKGYMRNLEGTGEHQAVGRILILEDRDRDGVMDHTHTFLDSLRLARAFAHVYGGLLYAEPPYLYFVDIEPGPRPGRRVVVDSSYAVGGNVEHQPNGLLWNIDNWIYSAKASRRYRQLPDGTWQTAATSFRGQWGITHDPYGRLIYNDNSNQLRGDWAVPNVLNRNPKYSPSFGIGQRLVEDQSVYPLLPSAVNRGYSKGTLDSTGRLRNFTSACGPLFFEGTGLPSEFLGDVFVCGPEVNLIKRNRLQVDQLRPEGKQALKQSEFLRSADEAFRPVNLHNGPDGGLYVVDMHRGIIQHKTYMTSYLRRLYIERGLDTVQGMGRILRVGSKLTPLRNLNLDAMTPRDWIDSLGSRNQWVRDRSQQLLILGDQRVWGEQIRRIADTHERESSRIHALYTMEGLGLFDPAKYDPADWADFPHLTAHLIKLGAERSHLWELEVVNSLAERRERVIDYYLSYYLAAHAGSVEGFAQLLGELWERYPDGEGFMEPSISAAAGQEDRISGLLPESELSTFFDSLARVEPPKPREWAYSDGLTRGRNLFMKHCASCHGPDGEGIRNLAPPLLDSEYVRGAPEGLASIMLYGMEGLLHVRGEAYEFPVSMPGIGGNDDLSDRDIAEIGNFTRNAFALSQRGIIPRMVDSLRRSGRAFDDTYTEAEYRKTFSDE